ncbi:MAG: hypothetical protein PHE58_01945 [Candidatus Omnitrophica bacterium]|nr:hypothetical protein [Candidatus Omnitrophota bacterium]
MGRTLIVLTILVIVFVLPLSFCEAGSFGSGGSSGGGGGGGGISVGSFSSMPSTSGGGKTTSGWSKPVISSSSSKSSATPAVKSTSTVSTSSSAKVSAQPSNTKYDWVTNYGWEKQTGGYQRATGQTSSSKEPIWDSSKVVYTQFTATPFENKLVDSANIKKGSWSGTDFKAVGYKEISTDWAITSTAGMDNMKFSGAGNIQLGYSKPGTAINVDSTIASVGTTFGTSGWNFDNKADPVKLNSLVADAKSFNFEEYIASKSQSTAKPVQVGNSVQMPTGGFKGLDSFRRSESVKTSTSFETTVTQEPFDESWSKNEIFHPYVEPVKPSSSGSSGGDGGDGGDNRASITLHMSDGMVHTYDAATRSQAVDKGAALANEGRVSGVIGVSGSDVRDSSNCYGSC